MLKQLKSNAKLSKTQEIDLLAKNARESCNDINSKFKNLDICDYDYSPDEAISELGVDEELINQLVEDYVVQILKSKAKFLEYIEELKTNKEELDFKKLRELAHKNLGVAKNLRIKDATLLLSHLMTSDDLKHIVVCVEALEVCAIKLKPTCAYETINL